jgi:hypothetical protein
MMFTFPARVRTHFFASPLLVNGQLVPNDATHGRAGQRVVVRQMSGDAADHRAAEAAGLGLARHERRAHQAEKQSGRHRGTLAMPREPDRFTLIPSRAVLGQGLSRQPERPAVDVAVASGSH